MVGFDRVKQASYHELHQSIDLQTTRRVLDRNTIRHLFVGQFIVKNLSKTQTIDANRKRNYRFTSTRA